MIVTRAAKAPLFARGMANTSSRSNRRHAGPDRLWRRLPSGLIYGLLNDLDLVTCCRIGSVMGAIKVAVQGPQNHNPTLDEIEDRFLRRLSATVFDLPFTVDIRGQYIENLRPRSNRDRNS